MFQTAVGERGRRGAPSPSLSLYPWPANVIKRKNFFSFYLNDSEMIFLCIAVYKSAFFREGNSC